MVRQIEHRHEAEHDAVDLRHVELRRPRPWRCKSGEADQAQRQRSRRASPSRCGSRGVARTWQLSPRDSRTDRRTPSAADLALRSAVTGVGRHRRRIGICADHCRRRIGSRALAGFGARRHRPAFLLREVRVDDVTWRPARRFARASRVRRRRRRRSVGLSRGAKNTNQPLSRRSRLALRAARRPWFEMTCAVPVLPATSLPATRARPPVPRAVDHHPHPVANRLQLSGVMSTFDCGGGAATGFQPLPVVHRLDEVRRDAGAAVGDRRHLDRHRHRRHRDLRPGRSTTEIVSPAYHFSPLRLAASTRSTARGP